MTGGEKSIHLPVVFFHLFSSTVSQLIYFHPFYQAMCCVTLPHHPPQNTSNTVAATFYKAISSDLCNSYLCSLQMLLSMFLGICLSSSHKMCGVLVNVSLVSSLWMSKYSSETELGGRGQERYTYPRATHSLSPSLFRTDKELTHTKEVWEAILPGTFSLWQTLHTHTHAYLRRYTQAKIKTNTQTDRHIYKDLRIIEYENLFRAQTIWAFTRLILAGVSE